MRRSGFAAALLLAATAAASAAPPQRPDPYYRYYEPRARHPGPPPPVYPGERIVRGPVTIYERAYVPHDPMLGYPLPERFCRVTYRGWDGGRRLYGPRRVEVCHDEW